MDSNLNFSQQCGLAESTHDFPGFELAHPSTYTYSAKTKLENQPMYLIGQWSREGVESLVSNLSHAIGYVAKNFSYALNNITSLYYGENNQPPVIEPAGLTGEITTTKITDLEFKVFVQNLKTEYNAQNSLQNEHLTVKTIDFELDYTEIYIKDVDNNASYTKSLTDNIIPINIKEVINLHAPNLLTVLSNSSLTYLQTKDIVSLKGEYSNATSRDINKLVYKKDLLSYNNEEKNTLLDQASDFLEKQINADMHLNTETFGYFNNQLFEQYPFIHKNSPCKNVKLEASYSVSDIILSRTYSAVPDSTKAELDHALDIYSKFSYASDIVSALSVSIAAGGHYSSASSDTHDTFMGISYAIHRFEPLRIVHCQNTEEMAQHSKDKEGSAENRAGYYSPEYNVVTFKGEISSSEDTLFAPAFIHESGHAVMNLLFKNGCNPFSKTNKNQQTDYEQAELGIFQHLAKKLNLSESKEVNFNNTADIIKAIKLSDLLKEDGIIENKIITSEDELLVLSELHSIIYQYPEELRATELIVRIPQLLTQGINPSVVENYFGPLMNYWEKNISPEVIRLNELHIESNTTDYCLDFNQQNLTVFM